METKYEKFIENDKRMMDGFSSLSLLAHMYRERIPIVNTMIKDSQKKSKKELSK